MKSKSDKLKVRPIVSSINTYNYDLSRFLADLLLPFINKDYCAEDTFMVSYDVISLFANIPLDETLDVAVDTIFKYNYEIKITKSELKKIFLFPTSETHFLFDNCYYDQIDGVAMGSPLGPVLANLFMSFHEDTFDLHLPTMFFNFTLNVDFFPDMCSYSISEKYTAASYNALTVKRIKPRLDRHDAS